jgi:hypothetical protein
VPRKVFFAFLRLATLVCGSLFALTFAQAQDAQTEYVAPVLITQAVDESDLVTLGGNTRPEAKAKYDRGRVDDNLPMEHLLLLLKRSPEQQQELGTLIEELHDSASPNFHRWLTAKEFGKRFGVADKDRDTIEAWLRSHGLTVNVDYTNDLLIDFSGTAGQVRETFHTEIHTLDVNGEKHIANMSDPRIPAALVPAVVGVVSLNDFRPHPMYVPRAEYTVSTGTGEKYLVVPGDLATIYNLNPLFSAGISGQGQTIVVVEDSDVYTAADWTSFRSTFGLSSYTDGSFKQVHPAAPGDTNNCSDPGPKSGSQIEAIVDAEYASAAAPSAAIVLASCTSKETFGGLIALQNLLNESSAPPAVVSMSYGDCEASSGAAANAAFNSTFEQAVSEGVSVFVSSGDHAAASCDVFDADAVDGIGITGWGSSPYNVSVGGTDFGDTFAGTNSTYWKSTNSATYESALSYVPEIPWNDSCASSLLAEFNGFSQTYGLTGFCNSSAGEADFVNTSGGGGGPSGCATGTPAQPGVVGGTCAGWPKPKYQSVLGNPKDGVRDIPDVSLFAANGVWLHAYPYCFSGPGGADCSEAPKKWPSAGGTSFSSPIMAGIQALVNQRAGKRQGNPNVVYYSLAATGYGTKGNSACNSTLGNGAEKSCVFYDVTLGDNDVDCDNGPALIDCYRPSGTNGVLSTSDDAYQPAFVATTGWDFASGVGTVNAYNLVNNWPGVAPSFTLSANPGNATITQGGAATSTITINPLNGFAGSVTLSASGLPSGVAAAFSPDPATSSSTLTLTASATAATGTVAVKITGTSGKVTSTTTVNLTVNAPVPSFSLAASPNTVTIANGGASGESTITITPLNGFSGSITLSASGLPKGVTATFSPNPVASTSALTLTAGTSAATGTVTVTITGTSGSLTETSAIQLTVTRSPTYTLGSNPSSLSIIQGTHGTSAISISRLNGFTGSVTFSASSLPGGVTAAFSPNPATSSSTLTLTASALAATGTVTVTVTGTSGSLTETTTIQLTVSPAPTFTLSANPSSLTITQASQGTGGISVTPLHGFSGNVTLSAAGLPKGVTASFSPNPATATSTLTLTANATAATGTVTLTITGVSGSLTKTTTAKLTVNPGLTLAASPSQLSVVQGDTGTSTIIINPEKNLVTLSASGLPSGVTAGFSPNPALSSSTLTLTVSATATEGTATIKITGTSDGLTATTTLALTVRALGNFKLTASPSPKTVAQGSSGTTTITVVPADGFDQEVTLRAANLPSGVTGSFSPNPTTLTSTLTLKVSGSTATGLSTITVMGSFKSLSNGLGVGLNVAQGP